MRRAVVEGLTGEVRPVGAAGGCCRSARSPSPSWPRMPAEKRLFKEALAGPAGVEADLRRALDAAGAEWPRGFSVHVKFVKAAARIGVLARASTSSPATRASLAAPVGAPSPGPRAGHRARADVDGVRAARPSRGRRPPRWRSGLIGRQPTVADANGRVVRRNDIAFVGEDEVSRSVSRAHAYVAWYRRRARGACSTSRARTAPWSRVRAG